MRKYRTCSMPEAGRIFLSFGHRIVLFAVLVLPLISLNLHAQDVTYEKSFSYLGVRVGYMQIDNLEDNGSLNIGFTSGYRINDPFAVEFSIDYHTSEFSDINRTTYAGQFSLLVYLASTQKQVQPYVLGGGGCVTGHL